MDQYSADALRFLLLCSPVLNAEDFSLQDKEVADVQRKLAMVWNMYDFFTLYADVDGWEWNGTCEDPCGDLTNPLDTWIVSRLHQVIEEVDEHMQRYDIPNAVKPLLPFIDDASNWYVRRSRKRFWKSEDDSDKNDAYKTLHYVLLQLSHVLAPFTPFMAEELFLKLTGGKLGESVHLRDWPEVGHVDELLLQRMQGVRHVITIGLSLRADNGLKVRQPLASASLKSSFKDFDPVLLEILKEELNVKEVIVDDKHPEPGKTVGENWAEGNVAQVYQVELDLKVTPELKREGMMREVVRLVQNTRKQAGLQVDDRIKLVLETGDKELAKAIHDFSDTIKQEVLATHLTSGGKAAHETTVKVDGVELTVKLEKA
jgi:isoleucyl-tRNA synthetase